jgi:hypothetical protein
MERINTRPEKFLDKLISGALFLNEVIPRRMREMSVLPKAQIAMQTIGKLKNWVKYSREKE